MALGGAVCRCVDKPPESKVLGSHHHLRCFLTSLRVRRKEENFHLDIFFFRRRPPLNNQAPAACVAWNKISRDIFMMISRPAMWIGVGVQYCAAYHSLDPQGGGGTCCKNGRVMDNESRQLGC